MTISPRILDNVVREARARCCPTRARFCTLCLQHFLSTFLQCFQTECLSIVSLLHSETQRNVARSADVFFRVCVCVCVRCTVRVFFILYKKSFCEVQNRKLRVCNFGFCDVVCRCHRYGHLFLSLLFPPSPENPNPVFCCAFPASVPASAEHPRVSLRPAEVVVASFVSSVFEGVFGGCCSRGGRGGWAQRGAHRKRDGAQRRAEAPWTVKSDRKATLAVHPDVAALGY